MFLSQSSYGVEDAEFAVIQLAQTTMRSELGMWYIVIYCSILWYTEVYCGILWYTVHVC